MRAKAISDMIVFARVSIDKDLTQWASYFRLKISVARYNIKNS